MSATRSTNPTSSVVTSFDGNTFIKKRSSFLVQNEPFNRFCEHGNLQLHKIASRPAPDFHERDAKPDVGLYSLNLFSHLDKNSDMIEKAEILHECKYDDFQDDGPFEPLDRPGLVVTQRILIPEPTFAEFYWRYSYATSTVRDHDISVERVLGQVKAKTVRETPELDEKCNLFLLELGENDYIIGKKGSPMGRSTRTFRAFCEQSEKIVFLKDTWPIIIAGQLPKHQIYPILHAKKVRNLAQLKERTRKTITHEAAEMFPSKDFPKIRKFRHYRLALDDVGRDLSAFSSVKELVKAIHDAVIAHDDAFFEANILHQDISVGNVIILGDGTGILIDWDSCKTMNPESENAIGRTGTWQFAAAHLLFGYDHEPRHNREDNLESFYHVLNWMALRHSSHSLNSQTLTSELERIFDYSHRLQSGTAAGGQSKLAEVVTGVSNKLATFKNRPLAKLLEAIRKVVAVRYQDEFDSEAEQVGINRYPSMVNRLPKVKRHEFTSLFAKALTSDQDWDANGAKVDHKLVEILVWNHHPPLF